MGNHIHFVNHGKTNLASVRMRVIKPMELLKDRGYKVTMSDTANIKAYANVFSKHLNPRYDSGVASLLKGHSKIIYDICDDHLDKDAAFHYKDMINHADMVTVSGIPLMEKTKKFIPAGGILSYVKDPITFPSYYPILNFKEPQLVWYGHATNVKPLLDISDSLSDPLTVISNKEVEGKFKFVQWEEGKVESTITKYDIVVLPLKSDTSKYTKNTNRAVDALHAGKFVITDCPEVYGELKDYIFIGGIKEGIQWFKDNPHKVQEIVLKGQEYVDDVYSDLRVGDMWEESICGKITRKDSEEVA